MLRNVRKTQYTLLCFGIVTTTSGCPSPSSDACETNACESSTAAAASDGGDVSDGGSVSSGDDGSTGNPDDQEIPCDVAEVLADRCWMCHGDTPNYGAPMSLTSLSDFSAPAVTDAELTVATLSHARLQSTTMPMPPGGDISDEQRDVLLAWLEDGTPAGDTTCDIDDPDDDQVGPEHLPCEPSHTIVARDPGSDEPFHVPASGAEDLLQCFTFASPFDGDDQAIAFAPIIDDERVIHHWQLFREGGEFVDGASFPCEESMFGSPEQPRSLLMGWAPGVQNFVTPDDVGLELPGPDEHFMLQVHYHNELGYTDAFDSSGVAVCTVEEPRANAAATVTLGSIAINIPAGESVQVTGVCDTTDLPEPVTLLATWPHMHLLGTSISMTHLPLGGQPSEVVSVDPWDFERQMYYPLDNVVIEPGDRLISECNYTNTTDEPVRVGEGTGDEMCFNFVLAYPISAFDGLANGRRRCMNGLPSGQ